MSQIMLVCPNCRYESPASHFQRLDNSLIKCRRCRGSFADPDAYRNEISYADTDSDKLISRFPFEISGLNATVKVPEEYLAYVSGAGEQPKVFHSGTHHIKGEASRLQVYYICLNPCIVWGSAGTDGFGAYGTAQLSLTAAYVKNGIGAELHSLYALENRLKTLLCNHLSSYLKDRLRQHSAAMLTQPAGYDGALGTIEDGVRLMRIYPQGYIDANHAVSMVHYAADYSEASKDQEKQINIKAPVTIEKLPERPYVVAKGNEEVFLQGLNRYERHKSGEQIEPEKLKGIKQLIRYTAKEFAFPHGWGIYRQTCNIPGLYSANGTVSFYVDSTYKMGTLVAKSGGFERFAEQFFNDVLRKELAEKLKPLLNHLSAKQDFDANRIRSSLSALSVALTEALNGENLSNGQNAFARYGLRVSRLDILDIHFNSIGDEYVQQ